MVASTPHHSSFTGLGKAALLAPLIAAGAAVAAAQTATADAVEWAEDLVSLAVPWRFRAGDDLAWARPEYDDSGWSEIP